jgi:myo-inositol 2-dehydrogenase / D-chiro-inositol 1-dehydrogenase
VDMVILATPPVFRPMHVEAAVKAGKHVFAEKPVAVDPLGVRSVIASVELARRKNLGFIGGTQLRWHHCYREIMQRVHDGQIGEVTGGECYWYGNFMSNWHAEVRKPEWSDMEYQIRCWPQFVWTSGDNFVEMVIHNVDILNWAMRKTPERAIGVGGHVNWEDWPVKGNVYDHIFVEFDYGKGVRMSASARQIKNTFARVGERIVGTKGFATPTIGQIEGEKPYKYGGEFPNPRELQHRAFVESIREGRPLNEGRQLAEATATVILGRTAAYTGRMLNYSWVRDESQLDLRPPKFEFGPLPVAPMAIPGKTELI